MVNVRSILHNFTLLKQIGGQTHSQILMAREKNIGLLVTLKIYEGEDLKSIAHELQGYQMLPHHPTLLRLYRGAVEPNRSFIIIREFYEQTLQTFLEKELKQLTRSFIREMCQQLLEVMADLTERGVRLECIGLRDVGIIEGVCKLINFEEWGTVDSEETKELGRYYGRKLAVLLRAILDAAFLADTLTH